MFDIDFKGGNTLDNDQEEAKGDESSKEEVRKEN